MARHLTRVDIVLGLFRLLCNCIAFVLVAPDPVADINAVVTVYHFCALLVLLWILIVE